MVSDTQITGPLLDNTVPSGSYLVGLIQTSGKPYIWPGGRIAFEVQGPAKSGNLSVLLPRWIGGGAPRYGAPFDRLVVLLVVALLAAVGLLSARKMVSVAQEGAQIRGEVLGPPGGQTVCRLGGKENENERAAKERRGPPTQVHPPHGRPGDDHRPDRVRPPGRADDRPAEPVPG